MTGESKTKNKKTLFIVLGIIGGLIFIFLAAIILLVSIGIIAAIAAPTMLNAADKARQGAVKANIAAGASVVTTHLYVNDETPEAAAKASIIDLEQSGTPNDTSDDPKSPYDSDLPAYSNKPGPGVVEIVADSNTNSVKIIGYGKDGSTVINSHIVKKEIESK